MYDTWDLEPIYHGFDDPAFEADLEAFRVNAEAFEAFAGELDGMDPLEGLRRGMLLQEEWFKPAEKLIMYASLRQAADATDSQAGSALGRAMAIYSGTAAPAAAFTQWVASLPNLGELISQDPMLEEYRFLLESGVEDSRHLLPGIAEAVAAKYGMSGSSAWAEMQNYLASTVPVSYRGQTISLPSVRAMAYDADPQVRKDAFEAELGCYDAIKVPSAYALNSIKLETLSDSALRGYASALDRTLQESHMERRTLEAMLGAIREYLPQFRKYLRTKAKALGHENGMPWYDMYAPMGAASGNYTPADARSYLVELFGSFDKELADMVDRAFEESWIDFFPRSGKAGGAFCEGVHCLKQSRVMVNFTGAFIDFVILAHELGHAFHEHILKDVRPLNHNYSMCVAETASTFNECIIMNRAIKDAKDNAERLNLLDAQLRDVTQIIVDIYSRFLFESAVFERRPREFMDADTLCEMMLDAQKQSYGDGLDETVMHPYMWICKSHYYGPIFYNFPYAFGGLFARGLYARYEQEGEAFIPKYKQLLKTTTVASAEDTARVAGIDLTDIDFWRSALDIVSGKIDLFCKLVEEQHP